MGDREEVIWAAGLFEGEGHWSLYTKPTKGTGSRLRTTRTAHAGLGSTDFDVIDKFARIVGIGAVHPEKKIDGRKQMWRWQTGKFEHVQALIAMFWPWLGDRRRKKAEQILRGYAAAWRGPDEYRAAAWRTRKGNA